MEVINTSDSSEKFLLLRSLQGDLHNALDRLDEGLVAFRAGDRGAFRFELIRVGDLLSTGVRKVEEILK